jgi:PAS domain S-box-containing protein
LNRTLPLSWVAFVNAGISIIAALITSYVANKILNKNKELEHSVAERTKNLSEVNSTLETSQSQLRAMFNATDIAFLLLDSDLQILTYNAIADRWSELSFGARLQKGDYFWKLLNRKRKEPIRQMMQSAMTGDQVNYVTQYPLRSGVLEWYQISMNPVKDQYDNVIGLCCSAINVTSNKMADKERRQIANELRQRNKDLEQFAYIVSHNLRAPLANIIGLAQILKQNGFTSNEKAETENLLFQSILTLDEIVRELNYILEIRPKINKKKENIVFSDLLKEVLTGFHLLIEKEHILILPDFFEAKELFTIRGYLYSIFFNLISNSIKNRQSGKQLVIEIRSWIENDKVVISIKDNGLGIDLDCKGNGILGLYKNPQTDMDGKGIGLLMVNSQVSALGGEIDIQSKPGVGTNFLIKLHYRGRRGRQKQ